MSPATSRQIHLVARPRGWPVLGDFALVEAPLPPLAEGQALVRNKFLSVDPYMRGRMDDAKSYVPPFQLGQPLEGGAVGEVVASHAPGLAPGTFVFSDRGWRDAFVADARELRVLDPRMQPLSAYLGVLGLTGFTAWLGLGLAEVKAGDRVFVSAAAGAVGSVAGQLAKLRGCRVVGSAGSKEKVHWLTEDLGFDAAFDYKDGDLPRQLKAAAPEGLDVYFDNVGGDHLEAALGALRKNGRVVCCGALARYNGEAPPAAPRNLPLVVTKRLTLRGFIAPDHAERFPAFLQEVAPLFFAGKLVARETVAEGLDQMPQAFLDLLHGRKLGKMVVRLA